MPGIGKKTAERIILELKDRIDFASLVPEEGEVTAGIERRLWDEATSALLSIGMTRANAEKALEKLDLSKLGDELRVEDIVREALKKITS
jgi:Holliday junction DNA helicase RuvA